MRIRFLLLAAVMACLAVASSASARDPNRAPSVSPYLNLLIPDQFGIPGGNPGQFQTLVEPFVEQRQAANANRNSLNRLNSQVNGARRGSSPSSGFGATGYHERYLNFSHYYSGIR